MNKPPDDEKKPDPQGLQSPLDGLRQAVLASARRLGGEDGAAGGGEEPSTGRRALTLERPKRAEFGDYSTNAALLLAPRLGAPPRELAERLGDSLKLRLGGSLERFEVAGPGFLNL